MQFVHKSNSPNLDMQPNQVYELLTNEDYKDASIAITRNCFATKGHYHTTFDELYLLLEGTITLQVIDTKSGQIKEVLMRENDICVVPKNMHHRIDNASEKNVLCVISLPGWRMDDEIPSELLE